MWCELIEMHAKYAGPAQLKKIERKQHCNFGLMFGGYGVLNNHVELEFKYKITNYK